MYVFILLFLFFNIFSIFAYNPITFNGSTPGLEDIVKGRCSEYQSYTRLDSLLVKVNCTTEVWIPFTNSFARKDPCKVNFTENDYKALFEKIQNKMNLTDKLMLWSGTKEVVHDFTAVNRNYHTLEDTFPGFIVNNLNWCGCVSCNEGINYGVCDKTCSSSLIPYWDLASRSFAEKAAGTVYVMVNGTQTGYYTAYWAGSTFGRIELPTLGKLQKVTLLKILVITDVDKEPKEKCGTGTLVDLVNDARKYNIGNIQCIDDPSMVNSILCAKYPDAKECQLKAAATVWKDTAIALIVVASLFLIIILILLIVIGKRKR